MKTYDEMELSHADRAKWTLPELLREQAHRHGDRTFLTVPETGEELSFHDVVANSERVAAGLIEAGAASGDRVLLMASNSSAWVLTWFGAALAGLASVPINVAYTGEFLRHQVETSGPNIAVIDAAVVDHVIDAAEGFASVQTIYVVGDSRAIGAEIDALKAAGWRAAPFQSLLRSIPRELPVVQANDLAAVFFTSGTTGLSKGAMMPHAQMYYFGHVCSSVTRLTPEDVYLASGPLFHANASLLGVLGAWIAGARFVLYSKFSAGKWIQWIRENGATVTNLVSVMSEFVWKQPAQPDDGDNDLRCIFAVPTAHALIEGFRRRFGVEEFVEVCGMTETSPVIMTPYGVSRPPGAAGLAVDEYFDLRLVDPDTDSDVAVGEIGELVIRPRVPWITSLGYIGMPDKTVETWRNLWIHTGDGLRRDEDGWFYYVDRLRDSIRRRGENISSQELEQAILLHPGIEDCAVVAVPAEIEAGEDEVMAAIVAAAGADLDPLALWAWLDTKLPAFAVPRFLRFPDSLPKTPSGKTRKGALRDHGSDGAFDRVIETAERQRA